MRRARRHRHDRRPSNPRSIEWCRGRRTCMTEPTPPLPAETRSAPQRSRLTRLYVGAICLLALLVSTAQIFDECAISLDGDMPRHLMNGAFLRDMVADGGIGSPREYMFRYFAQYPALSI